MEDKKRRLSGGEVKIIANIMGANVLICYNINQGRTVDRIGFFSEAEKLHNYMQKRKQLHLKAS